MNPARLAEAERHLNGMAKRVLELVPVQEPWTITQLMGEAARTGSRIDYRVMEGCLTVLKDAGLIREPSIKSYIRVMPRVRLTQVTKPEPKIESAMPAPASPDWVARLTDAADQMAKLSTALAAASTELTAIAIGVEAALKDNQAGTEKIQALRELLKGL